MTEAERVKAEAARLGFSHCGIARAEAPGEETQRMRSWLDRKYQATMGWMERTAAKRGNPALVLPGIRSVIAVAVNYFTPPHHPPGGDTGKISRYAWGDDYHDVMGERLGHYQEWLQANYPSARFLWYADTGPVMDKVWAQRAGIGWEGKHTNVITPDRGSWVFLGEILTTLELDPDEPAQDHCGTCTLCIEACPTGAIVEPYVVDSNLCISYLTIEHRGELPAGVPLDRWLFGCDVCQDVCPWNLKFARPTDEPRFQPREGSVAPALETWKKMSQEEFTKRFAGSAVRRTKWTGLMRNVRELLARARDSRS
jgi:epoxyqueuosine reductase